MDMFANNDQTDQSQNRPLTSPWMNPGASRGHQVSEVGVVAVNLAEKLDNLRNELSKYKI